MTNSILSLDNGEPFVRKNNEKEAVPRNVVINVFMLSNYNQTMPLNVSITYHIYSYKEKTNFHWFCFFCIFWQLKLGGFARLLFCWKASVYKLLWREVLVFLLFYTLISIFYRFVLSQSKDPHYKKTFEEVALYAYSYTAVFPISFVLGFYVTVVFDR